MKKAFLIVAAALTLAACGNNTRLTKEQVIEYGEIGYADIVSFIVVGYQSDWEDMSPEEMKLSPVYSYSSPYAGFVQKDIDGDGFEELLIGDGFEDGNYAIYDIYCFNKKNASLIHLASGGERDTFVINGDGIIIETGSNSAEDSFTKGFRIKDGKLVEVDSWHESLMKIEFEKFAQLAQPAPAAQPAQQLVGGFTAQREPTEEEVAMFKTATGVGEMTFTPLSVSTQVVAGTNYKFWCRYQDKDDSGHCWVVIFKPLPGQGEPKVSSIKKEN